MYEVPRRVSTIPATGMDIRAYCSQISDLSPSIVLPRIKNERYVLDHLKSPGVFWVNAPILNVHQVTMINITTYHFVFCSVDRSCSVPGLSISDIELSHSIGGDGESQSEAILNNDDGEENVYDSISPPSISNDRISEEECLKCYSSTSTHWEKGTGSAHIKNLRSSDILLLSSQLLYRSWDMNLIYLVC